MHVVKGLLLGEYTMDARATVLFHLILLPRPGRIIARRAAAVGNMEPAIHPQRRVQDDDEQLDGEVEDVEARLAMVPSRVVAGARGLDVRADAEGRPEAEQDGREQEDVDFGAEAAGADFVETSLARDDEAGENEGDGQEGDESVEDTAVDLDVAVDAAGVGVKGVEGLDGASDEHDEGDADDGVDGRESEREGAVPAEVRVGGADDALREDQVDDEEEDDAGGDEDLRRHGDAEVGRARRPYDAHDAGCYACHAEAEHQT